MDRNEIESGQKFDRKWIEMDRNRQNWIKMDRNGQKWIEMDRN